MDRGRNVSFVHTSSMVTSEKSRFLVDVTSQRKKTSYTALWRYVIALSTFVSTIGTYIIIARELGPKTFGIYLFIQWLTTISIPLLGTGMSPLTSRNIALVQSKEPPRLIAGVFYFLWYRQHFSILLYCLFSAVVAFVMTTYLHILALDLLLLAGLATLPIMLSGVAGTTLRSLHRGSILTVLHLLGALITLFLVVIATRLSGRPIEAFLLAFAMANTFTLILAIVCIIRLLPLEQAQKPGIFLKERLRTGLRHSSFLFILDVIIWQHGELLFLVWRVSSAEIAFYAIAAFLSARMIDIAPTLFSSCLLPMLVRTMPGYHYLNSYDAFVRSSCTIALLAVLLCALGILAAPLLIPVILGVAYLPLVRPLQILLISTVFGSIATVGLTYLAQYSHVGQTSLTHRQRLWAVMIAIVKVLISVPFILFGGIAGAALVSTTAQIVSSLLTIITCHKVLTQNHSKPQ